ncbi:hypothetical protein A0H81_13218 [Grifola frondosa]|uniref:Uncharacterized protein n=1 Tax=Grifola frondosa TaxID=5627 RepID=A0A1C7LPG7_GRIFR|nr:hypothetical protein A0H81_13218 [Grifola frondosa]
MIDQIKIIQCEVDRDYWYIFNATTKKKAAKACAQRATRSANFGVAEKPTSEPESDDEDYNDSQALMENPKWMRWMHEEFI